MKALKRETAMVMRETSCVKREASNVKRTADDADSGIAQKEAVPEKTAPDLAPMAVVTLQAVTYSPWQFFENNPLLFLADAEVRMVSARVPKRLRSCGVPGGSLESINDWMLVHGLEVVDVKSRPCFSGRWRGEYVVKIGRKGEREAFLSAFDLAQVERETSNVIRQASCVACGAQDW